MPFYVEYSTKRRTVAINGASPVQFIICEAFGYIVTLEATLNDYFNHRNVTFDWVQTRGVPVTLSHPNETVTTFEYTDTSDKIFRFYIDKDTAKETYIDVRVYHTPLSQSGTSHSSKTIIGTDVVRIASTSDTQKVNFSRTVVTNVLGEPALEFQLEYTAEESILLASTKLELLYSSDRNIPPSTIIETWLPGTYPTSYVAVAGYYMWVLTVDLGALSQGQFTSSLQVSNPSEATAIAGVRIIDDVVAMSVNLPPIEMIRFGFIKNSIVEEAAMEFVAAQDFTKLIRYTPTSKTLSDVYTETYIIGYSISGLQITKFNPSGIGSPI